MIGPVQSRYHEAVQYVKKSKVGRICWKGRFWAWSERVKEWWMMTVGMMTEMGWQVDEEMNRDKSGDADGMNLEVGTKDEVMHIYSKCMSDLLFSRRRWLASKKEWQKIRSGYFEEVE